jgi:hypothetical protein
MVSFHTADSYSILGIILGVALVPVGLLSLLFVVARALGG